MRIPSTQKHDASPSTWAAVSARVEALHVRQVNEDNLAEEVDMSDHLFERLKEEEIDALISVVVGRGLSILYKLHCKGINTVCITRSVEKFLHKSAPMPWALSRV
jgi:hypothetical protein